MSPVGVPRDFHLLQPPFGATCHFCQRRLSSPTPKISKRPSAFLPTACDLRRTSGDGRSMLSQSFVHPPFGAICQILNIPPDPIVNTSRRPSWFRCTNGLPISVPCGFPSDAQLLHCGSWSIFAPPTGRIVHVHMPALGIL